MLRDPLAKIKDLSMTTADFNNLMEVAKFAGIILASLGASFVQQWRQDRSQRKTDQSDDEKRLSEARDEDERIRQETVAQLLNLRTNYKERIDELTAELSRAKQSHNDERKVLVAAVSILSAGERLTSEQSYELRQIGVDVREAHQQTERHIERAKKVADDVASTLATAKESDPL